MAPLRTMKESLRSLDIRNLSGYTFDTSFISPIQIFRNLISLRVQVYCGDGGDDSRCAFKLNDDNIKELAVALSQLESLFLGHPCSKNTCATTVACLLPISVYCIKLRNLEIHFNTTNILDDFEIVFGDPRFEVLRSLPRCPLSCLEIYHMPLTVGDSGLGMVVEGMFHIFPSLEQCKGTSNNLDWEELSKRTAAVQLVRMVFPSE